MIKKEASGQKIEFRIITVPERYLPAPGSWILLVILF